jgi:hypothetical protein
MVLNISSSTSFKPFDLGRLIVEMSAEIHWKLKKQRWKEWHTVLVWQFFHMEARFHIMGRHIYIYIICIYI